MKRFSVLLCVFVLAAVAFGQKEQNTKDKEKEKPAAVAETKTVEPIDLAKKAIAAHGGDKFKNFKTFIVR